MSDDFELVACTPVMVRPEGFNPKAQIPYGCTVEHLRLAMSEFIDFLGFVNGQLNTKRISRLETMLMPANFSSLVGEFMGSAIPKHCPGLVKNDYHNGHPDLIPKGVFPKNAVLHGAEGIEIKASRYERGWQGHNPENVWLMVFVFDSNRPKDIGDTQNQKPRPFRFSQVVGAQLSMDDWTYSGRSETSRRTITASVNTTGYEKMTANWIYRDPELFTPPLL